MKKRAIKILLFTGLAVVVLLAGGYGGYKAYKSVRQARLLDQAREQIEKNDDRKAALFLQRALRYNNRDLEAVRMMGQLGDRVRSPAAVLWRSRAVDLAPDSLEDRLALARTALVNKNLETATNALAKVNEQGRSTAAYHNVAGSVAASSGRIADAVSHFSEAARLEPNNPAPQLNLAVLRLQSSNAVDKVEAKAAMVGLSQNTTNSQVRIQALRELTMQSLREKNIEAGLTYSRSLLNETNSSFNDRLIRLQLLEEARSPDLPKEIERVQQDAVAKPSSIIELANWKLPRVGPRQTYEWLQTLPDDSRTNNSVSLLQAECLTALQDWKGLETALTGQNWAELEFLRYAFRCRALRAQGLVAAAKAEWEVALRASYYQKETLALLLRVTSQWGWINEAEEVLWAIVNRFPAEKWAVYALAQTLQTNGQTRPLMELCSIEANRSPRDLAWKNNLAMLAMLLEARELKPVDMARQLYEVAGTNGSFASTYAFALYTQGRFPEALEIMQSLDQKQLEDPSISGYHGLILMANGETNRARSYLEWALRAKLLPEERKLFAQAKAR